jgi:hypothetical protein
MYSVLLMTAFALSTDAPAWGWPACCSGGCSDGYSGSYSGGCPDDDWYNYNAYYGYYPYGAWHQPGYSGGRGDRSFSPYNQVSPPRWGAGNVLHGPAVGLTPVPVDKDKTEGVPDGKDKDKDKDKDKEKDKDQDKDKGKDKDKDKADE